MVERIGEALATAISRWGEATVIYCAPLTGE